jgi:pimeloyl-ACP methyl ester carboxylesterase
VSAAELLVEPPLTSVAVRGGDLAVAVWPPAEGANADLGGSVGSAPPVVAIHGITATHRAWPHLAAALPDRTVIAPDLRGRGRSRSLPRPVGMATHADDVAAVIASLAGGGPVDVVGPSMGGFVAAVLAHRHPDLVRRLVLVDGGLPFAPAELGTTQAGLAAIRQRLETDFPSREAYVELFRGHPAFASDGGPALDAYAGYDAVEREGGAFGSSADVDAVIEDQADVLEGSALREALGDLPAATFLHAPRGFVDDPPGLYAPETVDALGPEFPQVTMELVEGVNHYTICLSERGAAAVAAALTR